MPYIAAAILIFTAMRFMVAAANLLQRQWLKAGRAFYNERVSILIPARNEENNIGMLLEGIIGQEYKNWEAIVYDDLSSDKTAEIVTGYQKTDYRIKLVRGSKLPEGWAGKNHACHNLAMQATGDVLLFIDADVIAGKTMLTDSHSHLRNNRLHLLSVFPTQVMKSAGEKLSVPIMNWILVSLLPLKMTFSSSYPSLSAANGQFMMFDAKTYRANLFHSTFKDSVAEDIEIARQMKRQKLKIHTLLDGGQVSCRMYSSLQEALNGFSRNITAYFGGSTMLTFAFMLATSFGAVPVYLALGPLWLAVYLAAALLIRGMVSVSGRQDVAFNILASPVQQFVLIVLTIRAILNKISGRITWKGRVIKY